MILFHWRHLAVAGDILGITTKEELCQYLVGMGRCTAQPCTISITGPMLSVVIMTKKAYLSTASCDSREKITPDVRCWVPWVELGWVGQGFGIRSLSM